MQDDDENTLTQHKWVRIMADFLAYGVWDKKGNLCPLDDLPVSDSLKRRIEAWVEWYTARSDHKEPPPVPFDVRLFSAQGLEIARDVKRALPDWTVVYFDAQRSSESRSGSGPEDRRYFEYEVT